MKNNLAKYRLYKEVGFSDEEIRLMGVDAYIIDEEMELTSVYFRLMDLTGFCHYSRDNEWLPCSENFWAEMFDKEWERFQDNSHAPVPNDKKSNYKKIIAAELEDLTEKYISAKGIRGNELLKMATDDYLGFLTKTEKMKLPKTREEVVSFLAKNGLDDSIFQLIEDGVIFTKGHGPSWLIDDVTKEEWKVIRDIYYAKIDNNSIGGIDRFSDRLSNDLAEKILNHYIEQFSNDINKKVIFSFLLWEMKFDGLIGDTMKKIDFKNLLNSRKVDVDEIYEKSRATLDRKSKANIRRRNEYLTIKEIYS